MQIHRLFEIIYILLDKKKITARELADHFGVSRQTISRDIDVLSVSGIPIYTERGKGGGISLLPDFVLNKSILTEKEQSEILSALQGLSNIRASETEHILKKLSTIFKSTPTNWLEVDYSGWNHENDFFNDFKQAILERHIIEFDYYNSHGKKAFYRIEPMQVWFKSKAWYLKGFCLSRQEIRLYKVSRIKNLIVTDERYEMRKSLNVIESPNLDYYNNSNNSVIKLRIEAEMAYRVYDEFQESEIEKQPDGSFLLILKYPEDNWLYSFILSFGNHIEVIEPKKLRNCIKEKAEEILKKHS